MVGFEGGFQLSVEAFYHSIGAWMVRGGVDSFDAKGCGKMREQRRFKLGTSIGCYGGRNTKGRDPVCHESTSHGCSGDVSERNCFRPTSETINDGKKVSKTL